MEVVSWAIARPIGGSASVGDPPRKKRDDPPSLGPGAVSPQERRRGRQARQAPLLPHARATGSFHYSSRPEAPGALSVFRSFASNMWGESSQGSPVRRAGSSMRPHLTRAEMGEGPHPGANLRQRGCALFGQAVTSEQARRRGRLATVSYEATFLRAMPPTFPNKRVDRDASHRGNQLKRCDGSSVSFATIAVLGSVGFSTPRRAGLT
jgi:hypothetical protein